MYDFYKNTVGDYVEGYLSTPEKFNGIVFLLREPNNPNPDNFWFKNSLYGKEIFKKDDTQKDKIKSKTAATKYKKRFTEMLNFVNVSELELFNAVYCNVHPEWGEKKMSNEYKKIMGQKSVEMFEDLIEAHNELTVFTCKDIYENIKKYCISVGYINQNEETEGLKYVDKNPLHKFEIRQDCYTIRVFEMYHPSYGASISY